MPDTVKCASWIITLPEPGSPDFAARLRCQEDYLGVHLTPWLLDAPPAWLRQCHSFHFMRYIDAGHAGHKAITIEFRLLASDSVLAQATPEVETLLGSQQVAGAISQFAAKRVTDWSVGEDYGGKAMTDSFADLLASSSRLALELLRNPRRDFADRNEIVENWAHCVKLIGRGD